MQERQRFSFSARNPRTYTRGRTEHYWLVEFEVTREDWDQLDMIPENALVELSGYFHSGDDPAPAPELNAGQQKGEYAKFWQEMCKRGILNSFDLCEALGTEIPKDNKAALYREFRVDSLAQINPAVFTRWAMGKQLDSLIEIAGRIVAEQYEAIPH